MLQSLSKSRVQILVVSRAWLVRSTRTSTYQAYIQRFFNDGIDVKQQSVEIDPVERIRRCTFYKDVDIWSYYKQMVPNAKTLGDGLSEGCVVSNDGPCIGTVRSGDGVDTLEWLSYSSVLEKSRQIGAFLWKELNLTTMHSKVAILSSNRAEYLFVEQGCYMHGLIVVSLYTTYDSKAIVNILRRTEAEVLVVDNYERIQGCVDELINNDQLKRIFVMDEMKFAEKSKIQSLSSIRNPMDGCERPKVDPESIATYILTSGKTGESDRTEKGSLMLDIRFQEIPKSPCSRMRTF
jgi:long-chain acyl-CoA synthetase